MRMFFDDALDAAIQLASEFVSEQERDLTLVRDLLGRFRLVCAGGPLELGVAKQWAARFSSGLQRYAYPQDQMWLAGELMPPDARDLRIAASRIGEFTVWLLDRVVIGAGWNRASAPEVRNTRRLALFSLKGGVGRSTTGSVMAWHLARLGKRVLVIDLDLESPGVGGMLLPMDRCPSFGVVDWFVEDAVGQADTVLRDMAGISSLAEGLEGDIRVVPAYGTQTHDYLGKLGRVYLERDSMRPVPWPERVAKMVKELEAEFKPDVVLLDSRAGLHDIGAAVVGQLADDVLLFAIDSPQTWRGYEFLFRHWNACGAARDVRERLWMVAAMVPESRRDEYRDSYREHAWNIFTENLYDEIGQQDVDAFSFDLNNTDAPHAVRPVYWTPALQGLDPSNPLDEQAIEAAFGDLLPWVEQLTQAGEDH